jgi:hypothetical protein
MEETWHARGCLKKRNLCGWHHGVKGLRVRWECEDSRLLPRPKKEVLGSTQPGDPASSDLRTEALLSCYMSVFKQLCKLLTRLMRGWLRSRTLNTDHVAERCRSMTPIHNQVYLHKRANKHHGPAQVGSTALEMSDCGPITSMNWRVTCWDLHGSRQVLEQRP